MNATRHDQVTTYDLHGLTYEQVRAIITGLRRTDGGTMGRRTADLDLAREIQSEVDQATMSTLKGYNDV